MSRVLETSPASAYIWRATGAMTKIVSTNASPVITWLGGTCWVPSAFLRMDNTTEIFTNEVNMITTNGASASAPSTMTMTTGFAV